MKFGLPIKFLFDDDAVSSSLCDEEGNARKVWCFKMWMVQSGAIRPFSEMGAALIMQGILTSREEVVGLAERLLALSLPCAEGNPGQVVFWFTVALYLASTVKE